MTRPINRVIAGLWHQFDQCNVNILHDWNAARATNKQDRSCNSPNPWAPATHVYPDAARVFPHQPHQFYQSLIGVNLGGSPPMGCHRPFFKNSIVARALSLLLIASTKSCASASYAACLAYVESRFDKHRFEQNHGFDALWHLGHQSQCNGRAKGMPNKWTGPSIKPRAL